MSEQTWLDREDWFEEVIRKAKTIEKEMALDIWKRYRECGRLLLEVGYKHSLEARGFKRKFMEAIGVKSLSTVNTMLQLGRMSDDELSGSIAKYGTIFRFACKLPITVDVQQYRESRKKPPKECECEQGNPGFPHCCVLCPSYKKKKVAA